MSPMPGFIVPGAKVQCYSCGRTVGTFNRAFFSTNLSIVLGVDVDWHSLHDNPCFGSNDNAQCTHCGVEEAYIKAKRTSDDKWWFRIYLENFGWWPDEAKTEKQLVSWAQNGRF